MAQRETEALGPLLRRVQAYTGCLDAGHRARHALDRRRLGRVQSPSELGEEIPPGARRARRSVRPRVVESVPRDGHAWSSPLWARWGNLSGGSCGGCRWRVDSGRILRWNIRSNLPAPGSPLRRRPAPALADDDEVVLEGLVSTLALERSPRATLLGATTEPAGSVAAHREPLDRYVALLDVRLKGGEWPRPVRGATRRHEGVKVVFLHRLRRRAGEPLRGNWAGGARVPLQADDGPASCGRTLERVNMGGEVTIDPAIAGAGGGGRRPAWGEWSGSGPAPISA